MSADNLTGRDPIIGAFEAHLEVLRERFIEFYSQDGLTPEKIRQMADEAVTKIRTGLDAAEATSARDELGTLLPIRIGWSIRLPGTK